VKAGELRRGVVTAADATAHSLGVLGLALGVAFGTSGAAATTGITVPLAYLIAGLGCLCLASVIARFTRRTASAGGLYSYIAEGLGPRAGFIGGWLYAGGFAIGVSFVLVIASFFWSAALNAHTGIGGGWYTWFFPLLGLVTVLALLDIRVSTRLQLVVTVAGVLAILVLAVAIVVQGGDDGLTAAPLDPGNAPSTSALFLGVVLGFTAFIGFEAAAVLGEEARDPLRAITRAVLTTVLIALAYYVFVTWAMAIGFGAGNAAAWAKDPAALDTLAVRYVGDWLATVIDFALAIGAFVGALAGLNLATRMLFAMGRDGALPSALGWTHPRRRTPWVAIGVVSTLTLVLVVAWGNHYGPITYFVLVATTATLAILVTYVLVAIAGIALLVREREGGLRLVPPVLAIAICVYTIDKSVVPAPKPPVDMAPYLAGGWLLAGLVVLGVLSARHPERVRAFG
jgi:amino acid transporter